MAKEKRSHFNLLCDIGEIAHLLADTSDINNFLGQAVELVARHLDADVCSIYLYDDIQDILVLKATKGLNPGAVDVVKLRPGEGLVGASFDDFQVVLEGNAQLNPKFKYFIEADEDMYHSFICVPMRRGVEKIGALVVQRREFDWFDKNDVRALKAAASQLAGSLENIRLLMEVRQSEIPKLHDHFPDVGNHPIKGTKASAGYAFGLSMVQRKARSIFMFRKVEGQKHCTKNDFEHAVEKTSKQLQSLQEGFVERLPESASLIFTAHFMILKDESFTGEMRRLIDDGMEPVDAIMSVSSHYISLFSESSYAYMREKALDVEDLALRILANMLEETNDEIRPKRIVIASALFPSDILKLASGEVLGIILAAGGIASHVAILCRSLQIPLVIANEPSLLDIKQRTPILLDADQGNIYVNPSDETVRLFEKQSLNRKSASVKAASMADRTVTASGESVSLLANINLLSEVSLAQKLKAEGIGLYRTEFPFLIRTTFPSEAEQYVIYKRLFDSMPNRVVTIRTLDVGGDKTLAYSNVQGEENPELGLRSIRFSLKHIDVFENQIRAVLRAAVGQRQARLMFPLISSVDEFRFAKNTVKKCMEALDTEGSGYNPDIAIGIMIELPAVLGTIDIFAKEVDFFSVGTNDFVQYMLAADRTNTLVADYYVPHHPSVLRGISTIANAAKAHNIPVSICGEMAREVQYIPFLLGIGVRMLSIDPQFMPDVQKKISGIDVQKAREHAERLLSMGTVRETSQEIEKFRSSI